MVILLFTWARDLVKGIDTSSLHRPHEPPGGLPTSLAAQEAFETDTMATTAIAIAKVRLQPLPTPSIQLEANSHLPSHGQ